VAFHRSGIAQLLTMLPLGQKLVRHDFTRLGRGD
jgi:hypothetical protein